VREQVSLNLLLGAAVQASGSRVGVVTDIYSDPAAEYIIGLEVTGPNDRRWFLPWVAASFEEGKVLATSPLVFVPVEQIDFYLRHGASLMKTDAGEPVVDAEGRIERSPESVAVSGSPKKGRGVS
jgi:sporulation protein YlmC with PRC-barrel domain